MYHFNKDKTPQLRTLLLTCIYLINQLKKHSTQDKWQVVHYTEYKDLTKHTYRRNVVQMEAARQLGPIKPLFSCGDKVLSYQLVPYIKDGELQTQPSFSFQNRSANLINYD